MTTLKKLIIPSIVLTAGLLLSYRYINSENGDMAFVKGGSLKTTDPVTQKSIEVKISPFLLDKNLVTVADFDVFVKATNYVTEAQKFGNAGVFDDQTQQWTLVDGADYHSPFGRSKPKAESNHPVTQVSWNDALAYAKWKGKRLPTQWEWEHAAKNGENSQQTIHLGKRSGS